MASSTVAGSKLERYPRRTVPLPDFAAWGYEPVTVDYIKQYRPESNSLGSGQVLHRPYKYEEAKIIVREMADDLSLELLRKGIATAKIELYIGFDRESLVEENGRYPQSASRNH